MGTRGAAGARRLTAASVGSGLAGPGGTGPGERPGAVGVPLGLLAGVGRRGEEVGNRRVGAQRGGVRRARPEGTPGQADGARGGGRRGGAGPPARAVCFPDAHVHLCKA